jgi:hypothetical protein
MMQDSILRGASAIEGARYLIIILKPAWRLGKLTSYRPPCLIWQNKRGLAITLWLVWWVGCQVADIIETLILCTSPTFHPMTWMMGRHLNKANRRLVTEGEMKRLYVLNCSGGHATPRAANLPTFKVTNLCPFQLFDDISTPRFRIYRQ